MLKWLVLNIAAMKYITHSSVIQDLLNDTKENINNFFIKMTNIESDLKEAIELNYTAGTITEDFKCPICGSNSFLVGTNADPIATFKEVDEIEDITTQKINLDGKEKIVKIHTRTSWEGYTDIECAHCHHNQSLKNLLDELKFLIEYMENNYDILPSEYLTPLKDIYQIHKERLEI